MLANHLFLWQLQQLEEFRQRSDSHDLPAYLPTTQISYTTYGFTIFGWSLRDICSSIDRICRVFCGSFRIIRMILESLYITDKVA